MAQHLRPGGLSTRIALRESTILFVAMLFQEDLISILIFYFLPGLSPSNQCTNSPNSVPQIFLRLRRRLAPQVRRLRTLRTFGLAWVISTYSISGKVVKSKVVTDSSGHGNPGRRSGSRGRANCGTLTGSPWRRSSSHRPGQHGKSYFHFPMRSHQKEHHHSYHATYPDTIPKHFHAYHKDPRD